MQILTAKVFENPRLAHGHAPPTQHCMRSWYQPPQEDRGGQEMNLCQGNFQFMLERKRKTIIAADERG